MFGLVALEIKLVPKGYYIDANVSTGRRLLRVVFTLNELFALFRGFYTITVYCVLFGEFLGDG